MTGTYCLGILIKYHVFLPDKKRIKNHGVRNIHTLVDDKVPYTAGSGFFAKKLVNS